MAKGEPLPSPRGVWAYAYELAPPQAEDRLDAVQALLDREHADAKSGARIWSSRLVVEERVTHILVVSDSPRQDLAANRHLEDALRELETRFSVTAPLAVSDESAQPPVKEA